MEWGGKGGGAVTGGVGVGVGGARKGEGWRGMEVGGEKEGGCAGVEGGEGAEGGGGWGGGGLRENPGI